MPYQETLLYGRHDIGEFAKNEAALAKERKQRFLAKLRKDDEGIGRHWTRCLDKWKKLSETNFGQTFEDFIFLTSLGIVVSIFSFVIDLVINRLTSGRFFLLHLLHFSTAAQFFGWVSCFIILACFSVGLTHFIAPTAAGSGIPEVKTMIRGVVLKEYLTLRTLITKIVGLMASLGSGLPVGKEGPFVHIAATSAAVISRRLPSFSSAFQNCDKRMADILAPASAVGVACTFASTVGGLLFSIETTATYFAIRNYWRSFYAAAVGTIAFRCLNTWINEEETLTALEKTYLRQDVPFTQAEMFAFLLLGIFSGIAGVLFIYTHKIIVITIRHRKKVSQFLQKNRFIYPTLVALAIGALQFPSGFGQYHAGHVTNPEALEELFSNFTWSGREAETIDEQHLLHTWSGPTHNVILTCGLFFIMRLLMCAISTTCPFPCGMIVPAFTIGAGLGRFFGEIMAYLFPNGIGGHLIVPGGYALVGSAAVAGAVTHTFSPVVIIFELTGQLGHILPCLVSVMIANMVSRMLTPSVYDVIIGIKKLPFLPAKIPSDNEIQSHWVLAEDIMVKDIKFLTCSSTYQEAATLLSEYSFKSFPIVNSVDDMLLLGAIHRRELHRAVDDALCLENKLVYFSRRIGLSRSLEANASSSSPTESQHDIHQVQSSKGRKFSVARVDHSRKISTTSVVNQFAANRKISTVSTTHRISTTSSQYSQIREILSSCTEEERRRYSVYFKPSISLDIHDPERDIEWRNYELSQAIDFDRCQVNLAPFQIVDKMSLYQIHSLFSLLSLHDTLVTNGGCLVGIISLKEVRSAIQGEINVSSPMPSIRNQFTAWCGCVGTANRTPAINEIVEMNTVKRKKKQLQEKESKQTI